MAFDKIDLGNKAAGIIGGGIGAAIGLFGGPAGAIAGGALGSAVADTLKDVAGRMLSNRELVRLDNASEYIATDIVQRLKNGEIVRQDGFFEGSHNYTSDGKELFEGILMKCKEQYQEKKVALISNIFTNVAFNSSISARAAYQTLNLAETLTYQKICMLAYLGRKSEFLDFEIFNDPAVWYPNLILPNEMQLALQDLLEMLNQGILSNKFGLSDTNSIVPGSMELLARGKMAFDLMNLSNVPKEDILLAVKPLEYQHIWGQSNNGSINGRPITN